MNDHEKLIIFLSVLTGLVLYVGLRLLIPWGDKKQIYFWIGAFFPLFAVTFLGMGGENQIFKNAVYSFCIGLMGGEWVRPRFTKWKISHDKRLKKRQK